jgi:hypothetical protein
MSDDGDLLTAQSLTLEEGSATRLVWMSNQSRPEPEMVMESKVTVHTGPKAVELRDQMRETMLMRKDG